MPRPRKRQTGLPSYCYRDRNGRFYMLHPAGRKDDGSLPGVCRGSQVATLRGRP